MIRFANPGSDIDGFTRIFQVLVEALEDRQPFSLDDISEALVSRGLATSSGSMGPEALRRSTRDDRSRDPLYNQSKMYSELFRLLGWLHPTADSRLIFNFTWLGLHVREARGNARSLVKECVLGIAFPNDVLAARGEYRLRPFATILRSMALLDGVICRDEMIVGPLCLQDDSDPVKCDEMVARLRALRGRTTRLEAALDSIATERSVQRNTMMNYTRFPLAILEWSHWTTKTRDSSIYKKSVVFHRLTDEGRQQVNWLNAAVDLRGEQVKKYGLAGQEATCKLAVVRMLGRAGFDTTGLQREEAGWAQVVARKRIIPDPARDILFSPFQEMPGSFVDGLYVTAPEASKSSTGPARLNGSKSGRAQGRHGSLVMTVRLRPRSTGPEKISAKGGGVARLIEKIASVHDGQPGRVVDELVQRFEKANKNEFYPLVAGLFACLGYDCTASRTGVNYERWDAIIKHPSDSVPIEIKSPAEETYLSVKGVRQALENKVILLARRPFQTREATAAYVVGYKLPSDRSEVGELVADIHTAFGLSIGIIDFRSLAELAVRVVVEGRSHDSETLLKLRGFIDVITS